MMGTIFEELIRKFNEALNENPGEHFTPRDVVHLMVDLLLAGDEQRIAKRGVAVTLHDPCCGSGGCSQSRRITSSARPNGKASTNSRRPSLRPGSESLTFAVSKSDLFMKSADGRDAENILFGSTLSNDRHGDRLFDYLIANPPYGKGLEARQGRPSRKSTSAAPPVASAPDCRASVTVSSFSSQHMLSHMHKVEEGGSRVAIIMNGSPLFTGDAGSGPSEIRRWILENDWLEALIALPEQLFYNTGIATYVWVLTNRKAAERKGKVQLINATTFWTQMRRSLGNKRRRNPGTNEAGRFCKSCASSRKASSRRSLSDNLLWLPEDHRRTSAQAELSASRRADRANSMTTRASRSSRPARRRRKRASERNRRWNETAGGDQSVPVEC